MGTHCTHLAKIIGMKPDRQVMCFRRGSPYFCSEWRGQAHLDAPGQSFCLKTCGPAKQCLSVVLLMTYRPNNQFSCFSTTSVVAGTVPGKLLFQHSVWWWIQEEAFLALHTKGCCHGDSDIFEGTCGLLPVSKIKLNTWMRMKHHPNIMINNIQLMKMGSWSWNIIGRNIFTTWGKPLWSSRILSIPWGFAAMMSIQSWLLLKGTSCQLICSLLYSSWEKIIVRKIWLLCWQWAIYA